MIGQRLDQIVRRQNLAPRVEYQRRQADERQRFAGGACSLQLEPGRHEGAAGKVRSQRVELVDDRSFDRPSGYGSFQDDKNHVPVWQRNRGARAPPGARRKQQLAVVWIRTSFRVRICVEVMLCQKTCMARGNQTIATLSTRNNIALGEFLHPLAEGRRGSPTHDFCVSYEKMASPRICNFGKLIQYARPKLGGERAFINPVNQPLVHGPVFYSASQRGEKIIMPTVGCQFVVIL